MIKNKMLCVVLCVQLFFTSCATLYDHYTFTETVEAKLQAKSLITLSTQPYADHITEVESLKNQIEKMVIYERAKNRNEITLKMWEYINRPNSAIHKFIKLWKDKGTLSPAFAEEFVEPIEKTFDLMIDYEIKKDKQSENALLQLFQT